MVTSARTETNHAFEPKNGGSTSFNDSKTVSKEFPKPDIVSSSSAASTPEVSKECGGQLNSNAIDSPDVLAMKGTF